MKRILALCSIVLLLFSCTGGNPSDVREIRLDESSISISVGSEAALGWTVLPETALDRSVGFSSSDGSIASVDDEGVVAGIAPGKCTITIASKANPKVFAACAITVTSAAAGGGGGGGSAPAIDQTKLDQSLAGGRKITEPIEISKEESVTLTGLIIGNIYSILPEEDHSPASSMLMIASSADNPSEGEAESDPVAEQPVLIPAGQGFIFEATATEMTIEASAISIKGSGSFQVSNLSAVNGIDDKPVEDGSGYFKDDMRVAFKDTDPLYATSSEKVFQKIYRINLSDFKGKDDNFDKSRVVILSENRGGGKGSSDYGVILDGKLLRNDAIIDLSGEDDILVFQERRYDLSGSNDAARNTLYLVTPNEMEEDQPVDLPYDSCVYEIKAAGKGNEEYVIEITSPFDPIGVFSFTDFPYARSTDGKFRKGGLLPISVTKNADDYKMIVYVGTIEEDFIFNHVYFDSNRNEGSGSGDPDDDFGKAKLRIATDEEKYENSICNIEFSNIEGNDIPVRVSADNRIVPFVFQDFEGKNVSAIKRETDEATVNQFKDGIRVRIIQGPNNGRSGYSTASISSGSDNYRTEIKNTRYLDHGFVLNPSGKDLDFKLALEF